jgi:hypothetical protein
MSAITVLLFGVVFLALAEKWCQAPFPTPVRATRRTRRYGA